MKRLDRLYITLISVSFALNLSSLVFRWIVEKLAGGVEWSMVPFMIINFPLTTLLKIGGYVPEGEAFVVIVGTTTVIHSAIIGLLLLPWQARNGAIKQG